MESKKFASYVKVGGRRIMKKNNQSAAILKDVLSKNLESFGKSNVDELTFDKKGKVYKYKNNIKVIFDSCKKPIGFFLSGFPEIKNKIVTDVPNNFEEAVRNLNIVNMREFDKLEEALGIE